MQHNQEHAHNHGCHQVVNPSALGSYLPLIGMVALVVLFTLVLRYTTNADWQFAMRMFMGGFFLVFGLLKVSKLRAFVIAYREYDIIAMRSWAYAYAYPFLEIAFAVAYFTAWNQVATNWVVLVIMVVSAIGVAIKLAKREEVPCACLGTVFKVPMTYVTLVEDLAMAAMALVMLVVS